MTRRLTPAERDLWDQVAATVKPRRVRAAPEPHHAPPPPASAPPTPVKRRTAVKPHPAPEPQAVLVPAPSPFDVTGLDGKRAARLRKGELPIDARIDLHGLTLAPAHAALLRFIHESRQRDARLLLVITGKGGAEGGALKRLVPLWLHDPALRPAVAALSPAHRRHGGGGAIYVYLRRRRGETRGDGA